MAVFLGFFSKAGITRLASHHQLLQKGNQKSLIQRWIIFLFNPICCHTWKSVQTANSLPHRKAAPKSKMEFCPTECSRSRFVTYKAQRGDRGYLGWSAANRDLVTPSETSGWDNAADPCSVCFLQGKKHHLCISKCTPLPFPVEANGRFPFRAP